MKLFFSTLFFSIGFLVFSQFEYAIIQNDTIKGSVTFKTIEDSYFKNYSKYGDQKVKYAVVKYGSGTGLYHKKRKDNTLFKKDSLIIFGKTYVRRNITNPKNSIIILAEGYNKETIDSVDFIIDEKNATYSYSYFDTMPKINSANIDSDSKIYIYNKGTDSFNLKEDAVKATDKNIKYLRNTLKILESLNSYSYLSDRANKHLINFLEDFKENINTLNKKHFFSKEEVELIESIKNWEYVPQFEIITPFGYKVGEGDYVNIGVKYKETNETKYIQKIRNAGVMSFSIATNIFISGLVDKSFYKDSVAIDSTTTEYHALLDKSKNISVGVGVSGNIELSTGSIYSHTFNVGMFVPFKEQPVPNLTLGTGFTLWNTRVKLNVNGGLAIGQVTAIKDQFLNTDISGTTYSDSDMTYKKWRPSWYTSFGISYNISKQSN